VLDQIILAATMALVGVLMVYLPVMKGPDAFFGIPVSDEFYRGSVARKYLQAYRLVTGLIVLAAIAVMLGATGLPLTPGLVLTALLVGCLGPMVPLVVFWRRLRPHEVGPRAGETAAVEERPANKWRYVSPWVEVLLVVGLVVLAGLTVWRYPQLPERIPTHWGPAGRADGWSRRTPFVFVSLLLLLGYLHALLLTLLVGMAQAPVRLPAARVEEYRAVRERYMAMWVQFTNAMRLALLVMFGGIVWASLFGIGRQAKGAAPPGMILVLIGTVGLFALLPWLIVRLYRLRGEMREIAGPGSLERTSPTEGWIGGMIYYNKQDPAIWVERRLGVGWTVNFAQPTAWLIMLLAIGVPIGAAVMAVVATAK